MNAQQFEESILNIIEAIYASDFIPESHKESYVGYIERNGVTEKMLSELQKIFGQEEQAIHLSLEEKKELLKGLEELIKIEQEKISQPQAEIVVAVENAAQKNVAKFRENLNDIENDLAASFENIGQESESSEIAAIRAKLKGEGGGD
ncbi:MAG: hypothetical protein Q8O95_05140 [bacterium]|nr:hypothetical protein [bacterium]